MRRLKARTAGVKGISLYMQSAQELDLRPVMTLEVAIDRLSTLIGERVEWSTIESFLPAEASGLYRKSAIASSFLAALELARKGRVELRQQSPFAPLYLKARHADA